MKKITFIMVLLLGVFFVNAQRVKDCSVKLMKDKRACVVGEFDVPKDVMEDVVEKFFSDEGFKKPKSKSGFKLYERTVYSKVSPDVLDIFVKVDGNKNNSSVTILASKGYDNFLSESEGGVYSKFKDVLRQMKNPAEKAYTQLKREEQKEVVEKTEEKYNRLVKEGENLKREKEKIENNIQKNRQAQDGMKNQLEKEKNILNEIK